jgi:hypothetical protein
VRHPQAFDLIDSDGFHLTRGRIADAVAAVQAVEPTAFTFSALPLTGLRGALRSTI